VPEVELVGDVGDGISAIDMVRSTSPDVVVLEIYMPGLSGFAAARDIVATWPGVRIVLLTRLRDLALVREALAAGVSGYVLKQSPFAELRAAIFAAARGAQYVDSGLSAGELLAPPARSTGALRVTEREWQVLQQTALGHSNRDVAAALHIAVKTVEVHKANAMRKLGLRDRTALVRFAVAQDWLREA
jgi:two-component system response regulator NreC